MKPSAIAATTVQRPPQPMPFQVNLNSSPHRSNTKKLGIQEGASDDQIGAQKKSVKKLKQTKLKEEDSADTNSTCSNVSSKVCLSQFKSTFIVLVARNLTKTSSADALSDQSKLTSFGKQHMYA